MTTNEAEDIVIEMLVDSVGDIVNANEFVTTKDELIKSIVMLTFRRLSAKDTGPISENTNEVL